MTAVASPAAAPWEAMGIDPDRALAEFGRRFPKVPVWLGEFTGHWFALVRDRGRVRLVEAETVVGLGHELEEVRGRMSLQRREDSRPARRACPGAGLDGRWISAAGRPASPHSVSHQAALSNRHHGRHEAPVRGGTVGRLFRALFGSVVAR